jgi:RNA polymerase sigma-70 factor (ECF subfamily)
LPESYRTVFMLRAVEEASTEETAEILGLTKENVKIRVLRARAMLRKDLFERIGLTSADAFPFHATRCDRVVANVMERIGQK